MDYIMGRMDSAHSDATDIQKKTCKRQLNTVLDVRRSSRLSSCVLTTNESDGPVPIRVSFSNSFDCKSSHGSLLRRLCSLESKLSANLPCDHSDIISSIMKSIRFYAMIRFLMGTQRPLKKFKGQMAGKKVRFCSSTKFSLIVWPSVISHNSRASCVPFLILRDSEE